MTFKKITLSDFITNSLNIQTKECYISREKNQKNNIKKLGSGLISQPRKTPVDFKVPKLLDDFGNVTSTNGTATFTDGELCTIFDSNWVN